MTTFTFRHDGRMCTAPDAHAMLMYCMACGVMMHHACTAWISLCPKASLQRPVIMALRSRKCGARWRMRCGLSWRWRSSRSRAHGGGGYAAAGRAGRWALKDQSPAVVSKGWAMLSHLLRNTLCLQVSCACIVLFALGSYRPRVRPILCHRRPMPGQPAKWRWWGSTVWRATRAAQCCRPPVQTSEAP